MTQKEKAKAYDEAIIKAKELYNQGLINPPLEHIFPELKESEYERIRKGMLQGFKDYGEPEYVWWEGVKVKECIAWLEKQGEQSSAKTCKDAWSEEDKNMLKKAIKLLDEFGGDRNAGAYTLQQMSCRYCADWLKSLKQRMQ